MRRVLAFLLLNCALASAQQAPIPMSDEIGGHPFAIRDKWVIGGNGDWDYLTLDPVARQLFISHESRVQVVDIDSGQLAGEVTGLGDAHAVVLDPARPNGYVTDGRAKSIEVFDRRSFQRLRKYQLRASPRALVLEPQTGLLFTFGIIGSSNLALPKGFHFDPRYPYQSVPDPCRSPNEYYQGSSDRIPQSLITVLDPESPPKVAELQMCGTFSAAVADGDGAIYFGISTTSQVGRLDAQLIANEIRHKEKPTLHRLQASTNADGSLFLDLRDATQVHSDGMRPAENLPEFQPFKVGSDCKDLNALAVDASRNRLFAACANQIFRVLSTDRNRTLASLTIGPGVDAIAFDKPRGLIFTANGGGYGSVTVIRQNLSDDYTVIQNLPTMERARTLALDQSTGQVYLVTDLHGVNLRDTPANGIGTLKLDAVNDSFQVLVVGN